MKPGNPWAWDKFTWAWIVLVVWFFVWEIWALIERRQDPDSVGNTLSEHIWFFRNMGGSFAFFLTASMVIWLAYHFIFEGR